MPESPLSFRNRSPELRKGGAVVGVTDRIYDVSGSTVIFEEVLLKGDLSGELEYNGTRLQVVKVDTAVGMLVDQRGARGPVWKGVTCAILGN